MGITGLIPFLEKASSKINVKDLKGCTVAVDAYCWLHRGAYGCADKLSRGESTNIHILYCMKFVNMLLSFNIKPIMVFDGGHLPAKALTEDRRRENRNQAKKRAAELLRLGQIEEAKVQLRRCIDITHNMVLELIQECRKRNVDCIVAPYEADAQLAYLNRKNVAQYVITEDSDLTLFGANKIIFKLDLTGNCLLVEAEKIYLAMGCKPENYSFDKFRNMCILSGCDYLDSLPGIGLAKACKFMLRVDDTEMTNALKKLPRYLNLRNLVVSEDYIENFLKAEATFKFMYVYDPFERKMVRLNEIPNDTKDYQTLCSNAGSLLDDETAYNLALGNLNPFTLDKVDDWDPNLNIANTDNVSKPQTLKSRLSSIWDLNFKPHTIKRQTSINGFIFKKIKYSSLDDLKDLETENDECVIASLYSESGPSTKKNRNSESPDIFDTAENFPIVNEIKHNPFAKSVLDSHLRNSNLSVINTSPQLCKLERLSKFQRTIVDNSKEIKSRFFMSNTILVQKLNENENYKTDLGTVNDCIEKPDISPKADENEININESYLTENESSPFKDIEQNEENHFKEFEFNDQKAHASNLDVIEISDSEINIKTETKKGVRRLGLSRKKSTRNINTNDTNSQTRLSMFGFKKKQSMQRLSRN